jgi:tetratricopeptide (TPR) repeat protein
VTTSGEPPAPVFISYAREDARFADRLAEDLERLQIPVWIDRRIQPGSRWDQEVEQAIKRATVMVVVLSKHSVSSLAVGDEFTFALDDGDLVVPVLFEDCEVPLRLARLQRVDFISDYGAGLEQLVARLKEPASALPPHMTSAAPVTAPVAGQPLSPPRATRPPLWTLLTLGAVAAGCLALWVVTHEPSPVAPPKPLAVASASAAARLPQPAASTSATPSASASADARSTQAAAQGELMITQYRSSADARSQLLASKDSWLAAAESFEAACALASAPKAQLDRWHSAGQFARGSYAVLAGHLEVAHQQFTDAIASDSSWAPPDIELADVLTRQGRYDEAHKHARHAQQLEPEFWLGAIAPGGIFAAQGDMNDAIAVYQAAAQRFDIPLIKGELALAYHAARSHDDLAEQLANEALKRDPNLISALTVLAEQALEARSASVARGYTQRLIDNDVFSVTAWLLHGDALLELGDRPGATQAYQHAVDLFTQTQQLGAPPQHLAEVQAALKAGKLPADRFASQKPPDRPTPAAATVERPFPMPGHLLPRPVFPGLQTTTAAPALSPVRAVQHAKD